MSEQAPSAGPTQRFQCPRTTGNACFAEGLRLCRGPNLGHSAKTLFAEGQPQEPSAKNGPRQRGLCRGYDPRQRQAHGKSNLCNALGKLGPLGHGGHFPSSFAEGHPLGPRQRFFFLCNEVIRQIFFKSLPRALDQDLGKDFFKTSSSAKFFFINRLCRGPEARPSAKKPFAEGQDRPSAKIFYF